MQSHFPGMDPYLESPAFWRGLHLRLISAISADLQPQLVPRYVALTQDGSPELGSESRQPAAALARKPLPRDEKGRTRHGTCRVRPFPAARELSGTKGATHIRRLNQTLSEQRCVKAEPPLAPGDAGWARERIAAWRAGVLHG